MLSYKNLLIIMDCKLILLKKIIMTAILIMTINNNNLLTKNKLFLITILKILFNKLF